MLEGKKGCGKSFGRSDGFRGVVFNHCLPLRNPHKSKIYDNILSSQSFVPAQSSHRLPLKPSHLHWLPPDSSTTSHGRYILVQTLQLSSNSFLLLPLFPSFKLQRVAGLTNAGFLALAGKAWDDLRDRLELCLCHISTTAMPWGGCQEPWPEAPFSPSSSPGFS